MNRFEVQPTPHGSRLLAFDIHTATHLDFPVSPDDLRSLILAAFKSPDDNPRAELAGVIADRTTSGIRLRVVANNSWFDLPWHLIARSVHSTWTRPHD